MTEGGLTWIRRRNQATDHYLYDTASGATKYLASNDNMAQQTDNATLTAFNNNGFSLGTNGGVNGNGNDFVGWNFRKAPGFFDVVTYTGNGSNRTIAHSLSSVPGMIFIKRTNDASDWIVYHQALDSSPEDYLLNLNTTAVKASAASTYFQSTAPTSSVFSLGSHANVNGNGETYVAYVFAGGESTNALARSVDLDGNDYLKTGSTSDLTMGTGDFTVECWFKFSTYPSSTVGIFQISETDGGFTSSSFGDTISVWVSSNTFRYNSNSQNVSSGVGYSAGVWYHVALVRQSGVSKLFLNGELISSSANTKNYSGTYLGIGGYYSSSYTMDGFISNFRVVKGTAVYTSSFKPPTEPLTNITNTKLLCCNNSSVTGTTVGTVSSGGNPTASTDSPFDDPGGFVYGENEDQNIIKTGSYIGNGSSTGPEINLGWEPQWLLIKNASTAKSWKLLDSMRGIVTGGMEAEMQADNNNAEHTGADRIDLTSTGFKLNATSPIYNGDGDTYIWTAIRRSDGYVGKPPELGTDSFNVALGNGSSTIPSFAANFAVDFAIVRQFANTQNNYVGSRLTGTNYLETNNIVAQNTSASFVFDSNAGWKNQTNNTNISWQWKRGNGFDVVCYEGNGVQGRDIPHSLGVAPNMMWVKNRTRTAGGGAYWNVYVSGITHLSVYGSDPDNRGNNPVSLRLNDTDAAQFSGSGNWDHTLPTSTHFTVGDTYTTNQNGESMIAMLFSSISGISKVGSFTGTGATQTITLGFQPRFLILKMVNSSSGAQWYVLDTVRGWGSGDDNFLELNTDDAQTGYNFGAPTSTGFELTATAGGINASGDKMIYYAHA